MSNLRAMAIAVLWRFMRYANALGISTVGRLKMFRPLRVSDSGVSQSAILYPAESEIRAANIPAESIDAPEDYPPLGFRQFRNVSVTANRRFTSIISGRDLLLPPAADHGPWRLRVGEPTVGGVLRQSDNSVLVHHRRNKVPVAKAIFVGSWSAHNWYHWIIDTLPSIFLARALPEEFDSYPVLVDEVALSRPAWLEPLATVIGDREVIPLSRTGYTTVSDLVWIDSPSSPGPLPLLKSGKPSFRVHPTALRAYREHLISTLDLEDIAQEPNKRLFLGRKATPNRPYNQEELITEAARFGYEPVFLEELNFADSVKVMMEAESVIGPHGAGWANALFCHPGTTGIMWTWSESLSDNWFSNIASVSEMKFTTLVTKDSLTGNHNLSPERLRRSLESLHISPS